MSQKKIFSILVVVVVGVIAFVVWGVSAPSVVAPEKVAEGNSSSSIVLFYGEECSHCKDLEKFLQENSIDSKVAFERLEVWHNDANARQMERRAKECGIEKDALGVPFLWAEGKCLIGGPDAKKFFQERSSIETQE